MNPPAGSGQARSTELIIDTDPGVDDALAILLASAHPRVRLHALTVVHGNVALERTVRNACRIADVVRDATGASVPVHAGCAGPLVHPPAENAARVHGVDGLGDVGWPDSPRQPEREHAALALVRMANEHPGRYTLAAIGPLTNLAVALHLDPALPGKLRRLVVMGGAVTGRGNVRSGCAEFNLYTDPEAAALIFSSWPMLDLVDWEATVRHGFPLETVDAWKRDGDERAAFYHSISGRVRAFVAQPGEAGEMRAADALALSVAVAPECVVEASEAYLRVETAGESRGLTWVDWGQRLRRAPNCRIVTSVRREAFLALMAAGLGAFRVRAER